MTADIMVRVERRFKEMFEKNPNVTLEEVKSNLEMRDFIDSNREISPLRKAKNAIELDNTNLTIKEQLKFAIDLLKEKSLVTKNELTAVALKNQLGNVAAT